MEIYAAETYLHFGKRPERHKSDSHAVLKHTSKSLSLKN